MKRTISTVVAVVILALASAAVATAMYIDRPGGTTVRHERTVHTGAYLAPPHKVGPPRRPAGR